MHVFELTTKDMTTNKIQLIPAPQWNEIKISAS